MCLIAYIPKDKKFPLDKLSVIYDNNPHGFGMMWAEGSKFKYIKGLFDMKEIEYMIKNNPQVGTAYHFRYATRGAVTDDNAHPFIIDETIGVMHNGTIQHIKTDDELSDSRILTNGMEKAYKAYGGGYIFSNDVRVPLENIIGANNRVLIMGIHRNKKKIRFLNSEEWKNVDGVPMSNTYSLISDLRAPWDWGGSDYYYCSDNYYNSDRRNHNKRRGKIRKVF